MNAPFLTQAADGLPRRGFTNADVVRMIEAGIIDPDESFELIEGEIVPMSPELDRHLRARSRLSRVFMKALGVDWLVATEGSLFLADNVELRPDLHVFRASLRSEEVRGPDVALAIELSSTTQKRDLTKKAPLYARHGVTELWVIDLDARTGTIFTRIEDGAYAGARPFAANESVTPSAFPQIALCIADLMQ